MNLNCELIKEILLEVEKHPNNEIAWGNNQDERVYHCQWLIDNNLIEADVHPEINNQKGIMSKSLTSSGVKLLKRINSDPTNLKIIIDSFIKMKARGH